MTATGVVCLVLFFTVWLVFSINGFRKKWSGTVSIGSGFILGCVVAIIAGLPTLLSESRNTTTTTNPAKIVSTLNVPAIVGKTKSEVNSLLGSPDSCKELKNTPCKIELCHYANVQVNFLYNSANAIIINFPNPIAQNESVMDKLGLRHPSRPPDYISNGGQDYIWSKKMNPEGYWGYETVDIHGDANRKMCVIIEFSSRNADCFSK